MLPEFELLMPSTLQDALGMMAERAPDARPLAGGTNLIPDLRAGTHRPGVLVNVEGLAELKGIRQQDGHVVVGSGVTMSELLADELIEECGNVLLQAARVFANPLVRNRATLGGNLGNASPAADSAPPLLALGAEARLSTSHGSRWVPLSHFFVGVCDTVSEPLELITAVRWPEPSSRSVGRFRKLMLRKAMAISVVSVAVQITVDDEGQCEEARIALGAVAPTPVRGYRAEELLRGERLSSELIEEASEAARGVASCIDDIRSSAEYRERVTDVLVRRVLTDVAEGLGQREETR
ncbi:MAG: xanthine dehydrogenase family protein subunit M [Anaerolineae bacterium]|jgi:carbon-monoxide dehydrogenase medium subunit